VDYFGQDGGNLKAGIYWLAIAFKPERWGGSVSAHGHV
jgi:hypothetical protein